jgi:hypothetical protein
MGLIKEPKGVDFIIQSEPLTDKDRKIISEFIAEYKSKRSKNVVRRVKRGSLKTTVVK